jgi:Flp pilus assembly protein TadG
LLFLSLGIVQFGIIFMATNGLTQVTRAGGRYAAVAAMKAPGVPPLAAGESADDYITRRMNEAAEAANLNPTDLRITISPAFEQRQAGSPVTITVVYNLRRKVFVPLVARGVPENYTRRSVFMLEGQ